jgi:hypothetical protein
MDFCTVDTFRSGRGRHLQSKLSLCATNATLIYMLVHQGTPQLLPDARLSWGTHAKATDVLSTDICTLLLVQIAHADIPLVLLTSTLAKIWCYTCQKMLRMHRWSVSCVKVYLSTADLCSMWHSTWKVQCFVCLKKMDA